MKKPKKNKRIQQTVGRVEPTKRYRVIEVTPGKKGRDLLERNTAFSPISKLSTLSSSKNKKIAAGPSQIAKPKKFSVATTAPRKSKKPRGL